MVLHPGLVSALEGVVRHGVVDHSRVERLFVELEFAVGESDQSTLGFRNFMTDAFRFHLAYLEMIVADFQTPAVETRSSSPLSHLLICVHENIASSPKAAPKWGIIMGSIIKSETLCVKRFSF